LKYATEFCILTPANLDRGHGLLWNNLTQNLRSGDPAQVLEREGLEVVTTDHSAGGR
jgi:hypothetical protein